MEALDCRWGAYYSRRMVETRFWRGGFTKALVLENPHSSLDTYLAEQGIEVERLNDPPATQAELIDVLRRGGHNLIFKRSGVEITEAVVEATPNLHAVMLCCIGDDSVDKQACARHGVLVTNDPISNGRSVAEMVLGEMICMGRRIFDAYDETRQHRWLKDNRRRYELQGKTLGVVGLGNIGKQVAQLGDSLGMKVVFYDNREVAQEVGETLGWVLAGSIGEVLARSHVVSLHLSADDWQGKTNTGVLDREALLGFGGSTDKPGPRIFINAARGTIFAPEHLVEAVKLGAIEYACVDVFPEEPHGRGADWQNPYADVPGIITTPHIGAATQEAQPRIARHVAGTTRQLNTRGRVRNCVFSPKYPVGVQGVEGASHILTVVHSDRRGTKHAIDEAIYEAGASNVGSAHRDFPKYGVAYDVSALDADLDDSQIDDLIRRAINYTKDPTAIRSLRIIAVSG